MDDRRLGSTRGSAYRSQGVIAVMELLAQQPQEEMVEPEYRILFLVHLYFILVVAAVPLTEVEQLIREQVALV